jgi:hypothetical protein
MVVGENRYKRGSDCILPNHSPRPKEFPLTPILLFKQNLTKPQKRRFDGLTTPGRIQAFLEELPYCDSNHYRSPLSVLNGAGACCFEGALVAAAAFWYHGMPPLLVELVANGNDDDHVLALYWKRGYWGACAKSNFSELRSREPVYRTVRELALSYFAGYFDENALHTLRGFTLPLDLRRFSSIPWLTSDRGVDRISDALDARRRNIIVTPAMARRLSTVDKRSYKAGILGGKETAAFTFYSKKPRHKYPTK